MQITNTNPDQQKNNDKEVVLAKEEVALFSKIWKPSWLILSAVMNAISLINIGRDLKIVIIRWADFFTQMFESFRKISDFLLSPFINWVHISIPPTIRSFFLIILILWMTWGISIFDITTKGEPDEAQIGSLTERIKTIGLVYIFSLVTTSFFWFIYACAGGFISFLALLLFFVYIIFFPYIVKVKYGKALFKTVLQQLSVIGITIFLISLVNYFITTF